MTIEQALCRWDGQSTSDLESIYNQYCSTEKFVLTIIQQAGMQPLQIAASWLLKHHLETGHKVEKGQTRNILRNINNLSQWEAKLHVLQCLPYLAIDRSEKKSVEAFLRKNLVDNNKFVRAWAYNGFYELAMQYPEYISEARQFFELAMQDEAASVKARIRNIMKKGFPGNSNSRAI